jgi:predicted Zn-dependent protease
VLGLRVFFNHRAGGPRPRLWPYASLRALEPLRANTIDVLLTSREEPDAKLFVQGREFAARLKEYAPHLSARAERWRSARPWVILIALIAAAVALVYALGWSPTKSIAAMLPQTWRERLGDATRESMTEGHNECADKAGLAALEVLTNRLARSVKISQPYKVRVYDWSLLNAFAVPGSQIVMTKELIDKAESPEEVAGVLAHEMGHGLELDPETGIIRAIGFGAAVELMLGGSGGGVALANIGLMLAQLGYTRKAERQADVHALEILKAASISPRGLGDFFKRVAKLETEEHRGNLSGPMSLLRTHPRIEDREKMVRAQTDYASTPALDPQTWQDLRSICRSTIDTSKEAKPG